MEHEGLGHCACAQQNFFLSEAESSFGKPGLQFLVCRYTVLPVQTYTALLG